LLDAIVLLRLRSCRAPENRATTRQNATKRDKTRQNATSVVYGTEWERRLQAAACSLLVGRYTKVIFACGGSL